jgi:hypothetical protein|tara:strand:- start:986 stop:1633 length:648 start_codon:yes stop_codon:yes gene_type:complete
MKKEQKPEVKFQENDIDYLLLDSEYELNLDSIINNLESYMVDNSGKGKSEEEKDVLYKSSQDMWKEYRNSLTEAKFNLHLNRSQYKLFSDILVTKLEYDADTVFVAIEISSALSKMKEHKFTNDTEVFPFKVNATELTYIYHLISKWKVKGLSSSAFVFAEILQRIGTVSKLFNYYDKFAKYLSEHIQNWITSFEDGVTLDGQNTVEDTQVEEVK